VVLIDLSQSPLLLAGCLSRSEHSRMTEPTPEAVLKAQRDIAAKMGLPFEQCFSRSQPKPEVCERARSNRVLVWWAVGFVLLGLPLLSFACNGEQRRTEPLDPALQELQRDYDPWDGSGAHRR
jgi:hypothetical protein